MWCFFLVFIFQTIFARSLSQCLFTLIEAIHFVGQFSMERKHGVNVDLLGSRCAGSLQQESRSQAECQVPLWDLFDTFPWECAKGFNQCKAYGNVTQYNEISPWMTLCFCPWLSNDTSTNRYGLYCLNKGMQLSDLWIDQEDENANVLFTIMTVPKLAIIHLCLPWVPWPLSHLTMMGTIWTSGALVPPGIKVDAVTPLLHDWGSHGWVISAGQGSRADTLGTPIGSQFILFHFGSQKLGPFFSAPSPFEQDEY